MGFWSSLGRVATAFSTFGASEAARLLPKKTFVNQIYGIPERAGSMLDPLEVPQPPPPAPAPDAAFTATPQPIPGSTSVESVQAKRRKKLSALQAGLASTIATGPGGLIGSPSLVRPVAGGSKTKLGA